MKQNLDSKTLADFQNGEQHAFRQVFNYFYKPLLYFTYKLTSNKEEAEDITLTTFSKLFKRAELFGTEANIKAFLYITARNNALDYLRSIKWRNEKQKEFAALMQDETFFEYEYEIRNEVLETIRNAINELPTECRKIFELLYFEELKPAEVASMLDISINTVRVQKSRALQALRIALADNPFVLAWLACAYLPQLLTSELLHISHL